MTSGQWTIGAATNASVCEPTASVSPSFTTRRRSANSVPKKFFIMRNACAEETTVVPGFASRNFAMQAEWSGSICCTIR